MIYFDKLVFLNTYFFIDHRGKSSHPGVIVDLSQNPDDPTR
ncbi:unnamed protein product, partial [Rotaria magnacalcarata]